MNYCGFVLFWHQIHNNACYVVAYNNANTHSHTPLTALCPGLRGWTGTRKVKPIWILLKQETVSGSGISWAICKSAPRVRQITTPAPHHSVFLQAGCPSATQQTRQSTEGKQCNNANKDRNQVASCITSNNRVPHFSVDHYPRESFREGLCNYRRWFVCLFVTTITK